MTGVRQRGRRALLPLALLIALGLGTSSTFAAKIAPLVVVNETETTTAGFPQRCYFDDETYHLQAIGSLAPGQTWTLVSPKPVCWYRMVSLVVEQSRYQGKFAPLVITLTDYDGHASPIRVTQPDSRTVLYRTCNTDLGRAHVEADPFAPTSTTWIADPAALYGGHYEYELIGSDTGAYHVTWSITNSGSVPASLDIRADIGETQWQGDWGGSSACLEVPA